LGVYFVAATIAACVSFDPVLESNVPVDDRPTVAIMSFGFDIDIKQLSYVKTVQGPLTPEEESRQLADALRDIQDETRWLFLSRLATAQGFRIVSPDQTDSLARELDMQPGVLPSAAQLAEFRNRLGADLVVAGNILDYGKIRWGWLAAGMMADMSWETLVIGLATAWNPAVILGNVGFELATSTPLWFGGGYLFGVSFRPVRVEARAFETVQGYPIWQSMEESAYAWGALKELPETVRDKKEVQLTLNLAEIMESLADSLVKEALKASQLRARH
jgi:hypothetical protein